MDNPITNTLFRFVNRRSPKLPEEKDLALKFIFRPTDIQDGVFDEAVANRAPGTSKWEAMLHAAESYVNVYNSVESLRDLYGPMYDFSLWIIRNRGNYKKAELDARVEAATGTLNLENLWNDLIYQVVTQRSFYIKEAIMQLLLANHIVSNYNPSTPRTDITPKQYAAMLVNARVVLPVALFDKNNEDYTVSSSNKYSEDNYVAYKPGKDLLRDLELASAKRKLNAYANLRKELETLQRDYEKYAESEYASKYANYIKTVVDPAESRYQAALKEALDDYCEIRGDGEVYNENDPCRRPNAVYMVNIPEFTITYKPELDVATLKAGLSPESWLTLLDLLGYQPETVLKLPYNTDITGKYATIELAIYKTYDQLLQFLSENVSTQHKLVSANSNYSSSKVSVGGVLINVAQIIDLDPFNFILCGHYSTLSTVFSLAIGIPNDEWQVYQIIVHQTIGSVTTNTTVHGPAFTQIGGVVRINSFYSYVYPEGNATSGATFKFDVKFTNGATKSIDTVSGTLSSCVRGIAKGENPEPSAGPHKAPFIPSGFGLLNLGTAEYKRVEQTLQCYVEGEVSQIENVMAREYREKATRFLRRSEETVTTSTDTEREKLRDTSTTERYELQSEINQVLQESSEFSGHVDSEVKYKSVTIDAGISYAQNTSAEDSMHQAMTIAKEITNRALDRVVTRVKEERIRKITEEFEENNKHGFDNRNGRKHVTGVYRWVDKLYKNRIYNYGNRTMLEFMIPEPARLHQLWINEKVDANYTELIPPVDPRTVDMATFLDVDEAKALTWASRYGVEYNVKPASKVTVGDSYNVMMSNEMSLASIRAESGNGKIKIPDGYKATKALGYFTAVGDLSPFSGNSFLLSLSVGNKTVTFSKNKSRYVLFLNTDNNTPPTDESYFGGPFDTDQSYCYEVPVSYTLGNYVSGDISVIINCQLTLEAENRWKQETFNAIIAGYQDALDEYNKKLASENTKATINRKSNPGFYRQIENVILKKNCISYLISQNDQDPLTFGNENLTKDGDSFFNYKVNVDPLLSEYGGFVKFFEQAFEWNIMSYNFYPYYWGNRNRWSTLYESNEFDDPTFRKFLQAGMARVVVTVRPGFEEAVNLYLSTGLMWNGGQIPVLGDPLYLSLINEVLQTEATPEGKAWVTRVPTSLTILQAGTIGLEVEEALPCNCDPESLAEFENPSEIPCNDNFKPRNYEIGQVYPPETETPAP